MWKLRPVLRRRIERRLRPISTLFSRRGRHTFPDMRPASPDEFRLRSRNMALQRHSRVRELPEERVVDRLKLWLHCPYQLVRPRDRRGIRRGPRRAFRALVLCLSRRLATAATGLDCASRGCAARRCQTSARMSRPWMTTCHRLDHRRGFTKPRSTRRILTRTASKERIWNVSNVGAVPRKRQRPSKQSTTTGAERRGRRGFK